MYLLKVSCRYLSIFTTFVYTHIQNFPMMHLQHLLCLMNPSALIDISRITTSIFTSVCCWFSLFIWEIPPSRLYSVYCVVDDHPGKYLS